MSLDSERQEIVRTGVESEPLRFKDLLKKASTHRRRRGGLREGHPL
jgi:hypothetical protein